MPPSKETTLNPAIEAKGLADFDLHGHTVTPFFDTGDETITYLERVTVVDRHEAARWMQKQHEEFTGESQRFHPEPIYMRWAKDERIEGGEGWFVCDGDHPDATPFWRDR